MQGKSQRWFLEKIVRLSRSQVGSTFALLHFVAPDKVSAFQARMRHLQRLGIPPGVNTGKGRPADYGPSQVVILAVALELLQLGLTPERSAKLITRHYAMIAGASLKAVGSLSGCNRLEEIFLVFDPTGLQDVSAFWALDDMAAVSMHVETAESIKDRIDIWMGAREGVSTRTALINISRLFWELSESVPKFSTVTAEQFFGAIESWAREDPQANVDDPEA